MKLLKVIEIFFIGLIALFLFLILINKSGKYQLFFPFGRDYHYDFASTFYLLDTTTGETHVYATRESDLRVITLGTIPKPKTPTEKDNKIQLVTIDQIEEMKKQKQIMTTEELFGNR